METYKTALARPEADEDALIKCIKVAIQSYIEAELKTSTKTDALKEQIRSLCHKEFVIPSTIHEWSLQTVETTNMKFKTQVPAIRQAQLQLEEPTQPLFCKDTLYHASLCCEAVSMHNIANFKNVFHTSGHHLDEISMSISEGRENVDQYLIACSKQTKTLYIAFRSEGTLSGWMNKYSSFEEGQLFCLSVMNCVMNYVVDKGNYDYDFCTIHCRPP